MQNGGKWGLSHRSQQNYKPTVNFPNRKIYQIVFEGEKRLQAQQKTWVTNQKNTKDAKRAFKRTSKQKKIIAQKAESKKLKLGEDD